MRERVRALIGSPLRNLAAAVGFTATVGAVATVGYMTLGWSFADAIYMVVLTVFSVGYGEVHPISTPALHVLTVMTMVFGCTGMIVLTGSLVQVFTVGHIRELMGHNRVNAAIHRLRNHVIVCGYGRIGVMLTKDLADGGASVVVIEKDSVRAAEAEAAGLICLMGDAGEEATLKTAGVERARVLATVLPNDAANVFITLTARSLNPALQIIARGEQPSTESKLTYAGADKVVLPTHIGAERIAEMILFPETARFIHGSERMRQFEKTLRDLGLGLQMITVAKDSAAVGASVAELERRAKGGFFVIQVDRQGGDAVTRPEPAFRVAAGDGVLVVARDDATIIGQVFHAAADRVRAGRTVF